VPGNAVTDDAKPGQVDEEPLLEECGQRVVEVSELRESPEIRRDLGCVASQAEEVRQHTEALLDLGL
jgi:hypothetical protein